MFILFHVFISFCFLFKLFLNFFHFLFIVIYKEVYIDYCNFILWCIIKIVLYFRKFLPKIINLKQSRTQWLFLLLYCKGMYFSTPIIGNLFLIIILLFQLVTKVYFYSPMLLLLLSFYLLYFLWYFLFLKFVRVNTSHFFKFNLTFLLFIYLYLTSFWTLRSRILPFIFLRVRYYAFYRSLWRWWCCFSLKTTRNHSSLFNILF